MEDIKIDSIMEEKERAEGDREMKERNAMACEAFKG